MHSSLFHIGSLLLALIGSSLYSGYCYSNKQYLLMVLSISIATIICVRIIRLQQRSAHMFNRMLEDIRYNDFSLHFSSKGKSKTEQRMALQINDVMERLKKIHLGYEEQMQYYKTLLDTIDSCIIVSNPSGEVVWSNHHAETQLCGHAFHSLNDLSSIDTKFPLLLQKMKPGDIKTIRIYKNDLAIDWAITVTEYIKKGIGYRLFHLRNIRSLLEENEMEAWQKLVRVLTHEIMNSIAPIISLSETLVDYLPQDEEQSSATHTSLPDDEEEDDMDENMQGPSIIEQGLQTIHRRSKGLLEFVENYRKLTRISSPILVLVTVNELLEELRKLFSNLPIDFRGDHLDSQLMIDRSQIEQVLINLIKNAYEACEETTEPQIIVRGHLDEDLNIFLISVSDNGKGIIPEVLDRIFVPFFTTKSSGSGIGLSISKQIMMLHGGSISVTSVPNKRTSFTLKFVNVKC